MTSELETDTTLGLRRNAKPETPVSTRKNGADPERFTEEGWIAKYNMSVSSTLPCTNVIEPTQLQSSILMVLFLELSNIVIDSGSTSNVACADCLRKYDDLQQSPRKAGSGRLFKFVDDRVFKSKAEVDTTLRIPLRAKNSCRWRAYLFETESGYY